MKKLLLFLLLLPATFLNVSAQNLSMPLSLDPAVLHGKFANGLTYYVKSNSKPEKKVELRLVVKVGSVVEDDDQQGLAHFMEHMNFNGTKHFEKNELVDYLQSIGVEFGADLNAYTSFDETVYILPVPTDKPGNLEKGFQILEDWAHNALLTDTDIDEERGVVLEESRLGKGADQRMLDKYLPAYVAGSKYAERLPIGKDSILRNFSYETLRRFYRDWYRPDLQAVVVAGDIDTATAMQLIRKHFEGIPAAVNPRKRVYEQIAERTGSETMVLTDREATKADLQLMFPYRKTPECKTLGDYRSYLRRELLLAMINNRLYELAQGSESPFTYAYTGYDNLLKGYENLVCGSMFGEEGPEKALHAMVAELIRAQRYGFRKEELELVKEELLADIETRFNERNTTDSEEFAEEYIGHFLQEEPVPGIELEAAWIGQLLPGIKLGELNRLAKELTGPPHTFALITAPQQDSLNLPDAAGLQKMVTAAWEQKPARKKKEKTIKELMPVKPAPGSIIAAQQDAALQTITYTLSNGINVTVKPTRFKNDEIVFRGIKKGGYNNYPAESRNDMQFASRMIDAMGLGSYTSNEINRVLADKPVYIRANFSRIENKIDGESNVKSLETLLQLAHLHITQPRFDPEFLETFRKNLKNSYGQLLSNPEYAFVDTLDKVLHDNNPLIISRYPTTQDIDSFNAENAYEIYRKELGSADGYHFFLVGAIDTLALRPLIETYLGSIPAANTTPAFKDDGVRSVQNEHTFTLHKGKEKKSLICMFYPGETVFSEETDLNARAAGAILNLKITEELREKKGAIYTGEAVAYLDRDPYSSYGGLIVIKCGPDNVDTLLAALNSEIRQLIETGPSEKDLDKIKATWREQRRINMQENGFWADELQNIYFWEYSKKNFLHYDERVEKLSRADVQEAARLIFGGKNKFTSILYPESWERKQE